MDHLPEKDERKEDLMEKTEAAPQRHQGSFTTGFLAGVLTALFCVSVFLMGWNIGERRFAKKDTSSVEEETEDPDRSIDLFDAGRGKKSDRKQLFK